jgi:hypothetical protein
VKPAELAYHNRRIAESIADSRRSRVRALICLVIVAVLAVLALGACAGPTSPGPIPGELTIERVDYFPRTPGNAVDSAVVRIRARWHPGQFALVVHGGQWAPVARDVVIEGDAILPVTLVRVGSPPLIKPDTITATAVNFRGAMKVSR